MKSKKRPLTAAVLGALLALAGSVSAQATGGSPNKQAGTGRKGRIHQRRGSTKVRSHKHKGRRKHSRRSPRSLNPQPLPPE